MPKMKTRKTVAKRFRTTGSGKLMHVQRNKRHILTKKSAKRKRQLRQEKELANTHRTKFIRDSIDH